MFVSNAAANARTILIYREVFWDFCCVQHVKETLLSGIPTIAPYFVDFVSLSGAAYFQHIFLL